MFPFPHRCQEACLEHLESSKRALEQELSAKHQEELRTAGSSLQREAAEARQHSERLQGELAEVKELYVNVCSAKDGLETTLKEKYEEDMEKKVIEVRQT